MFDFSELRGISPFNRSEFRSISEVSTQILRPQNKQLHFKTQILKETKHYEDNHGFNRTENDQEYTDISQCM